MVITIDKILNYLRNVTYPAEKASLIKEAQKANADKESLSLLEELPERKFSSQLEVNRILNQVIQKQRETGPR